MTHIEKNPYGRGQNKGVRNGNIKGTVQSCDMKHHTSHIQHVHTLVKYHISMYTLMLSKVVIAVTESSHMNGS